MSATTAHAIARPYARAVFSCAEKKGDRTEWLTFLKTLEHIVQSPAVKRLQNTYHSDFVVSVILDFFGGLENIEQKNFLQVVVEHRRLLWIPDILQAFQALCDKADRRIPVQLITAAPLKAVQKQRFERILQQRLRSNIRLDCKVNEALRSGVVVRIHNWTYDASALGRFQALADRLRSL